VTVFATEIQRERHYDSTPEPLFLHSLGKLFAKANGSDVEKAVAPDVALSRNDSIKAKGFIRELTNMPLNDAGVGQADAMSIEYLDGLYSYALVLTRNHAEAEDLVQETYIRAMQAMRKLRADSHIKGWLLLS
jgi:hypothetical protein